MGLTFHYKGTIQDTKRIVELTEEVKDICETMDWRYQNRNFEFEFDAHILQHLGFEDHSKILLRGIMFCPHPESEWVYLYFTEKGQLTSPATLQFVDTNSDPVLIFSAFTKTQYAGPEIHIAILKLLDYLNKKYNLSLDINDEGEYWETKDETRLKNNFERNGVLIDMVAHALKGTENAPAMTPFGILKQIENILKKISDRDGEHLK
jgi:hypothetical protein